MSTQTLERQIEEAGVEYAKLRAKGCVMKAADVTVTAWLEANPTLKAAVSQIVTDLVKQFDDTESDVDLSIMRDPDTGEESLVLQVITTMAGKEARARLREFTAQDLPSCADEIIFSITHVPHRGA